MDPEERLSPSIDAESSGMVPARRPCIDGTEAERAQDEAKKRVGMAVGWRPGPLRCSSKEWNGAFDFATCWKDLEDAVSSRKRMQARTLCGGFSEMDAGHRPHCSTVPLVLLEDWGEGFQGTLKREIALRISSSLDEAIRSIDSISSAERRNTSRELRAAGNAQKASPKPQANIPNGEGRRRTKQYAFGSVVPPRKEVVFNRTHLSERKWEGDANFVSKRTLKDAGDRTILRVGRHETRQGKTFTVNDCVGEVHRKSSRENGKISVLHRRHGTIADGKGQATLTGSTPGDSNGLALGMKKQGATALMTVTAQSPSIEARTVSDQASGGRNLLAHRDDTLCYAIVQCATSDQSLLPESTLTGPGSCSSICFSPVSIRKKESPSYLAESVASIDSDEWFHDPDDSESSQSYSLGELPSRLTVDDSDIGENQIRG